MSPGSRIFIVVIASSLAAILQMKGFSARFFTSPLEALAAARLESPDLVITDVAMPGVSGIDLAIQVIAQHPDCKILLFSGQAATSDLLEDARARGHDFRFLPKPVHPSIRVSRGNRETLRMNDDQEIDYEYHADRLLLLIAQRDELQADSDIIPH